MSIDDSVTIWQTPAVDGKPEYRVAYESVGGELGLAEIGQLSPELLRARDARILKVFGDCEVFRDFADAHREAERIFRDCVENSPYGTPENGICLVESGSFPSQAPPVRSSAVLPMSRSAKRRKREAALRRELEAVTAQRDTLREQITYLLAHR
jgi:hypothetical protein